MGKATVCPHAFLNQESHILLIVRKVRAHVIHMNSHKAQTQVVSSQWKSMIQCYTIAGFKTGEVITRSRQKLINMLVAADVFCLLMEGCAGESNKQLPRSV